MKTVVLFGLIFNTVCGIAQTKIDILLPYKNRVFIEAGGNAGIGSINYERDINAFEHNNVQLLFRTGFSFFPVDKNTGSVLVFPNSVNLLLGVTHYAEFGLGQTFSFTTKGSGFIRSVINIGYRYQPPSQRINFRLMYTPIISNLWDVQYQHWAGISVGYQFRLKKER